MTPASCPVCADTGIDKAYEARWKETVVAFYRCTACGHHFAHPPRSAQELSSIYDGGDYWDSSGANAFMYQDYLRQKEALCADARHKFDAARRFLGWELHKGLRVLDVGCGCGFSMLPLAESGVDVRGVELSRAMSDYARNTLGLPCATALIEQYHPEDDQRFDMIVSWGTALNFSDPLGAYSAMARLLRPQGCLVLDLFDIGSPFAFLTAGKRRKGIQVTHCYTRRSMEIMLQRAGFTRIDALAYTPRFSLSFIGTQLDSTIIRWLAQWPSLRDVAIPAPVPGSQLVFARQPRPTSPNRSGIDHIEMITSMIHDKVPADK